MKSKIICIVGPSGCGKTSLVNFIEKTTGIKTLVSYTTRPMRHDEVDGINHWYVKHKDMPDRSEMFAYTIFNGYHYWTNINDVPKNGMVTYVIDGKGVNTLTERFNEMFDIFTIYIRRDEKLLIEAVGEDRVNRDKERLHFDNNAYDAIIDNNGSLSDFFNIASETIAKLIR